MTNTTTPELDGIPEATAEPEPEPASDEETATAPAAPAKPEATKAAKPRSKRTRVARTFPASSFAEALPLGTAIQRFAAGNKVRRLTLFEQMERSADSSTSRKLVTNSNQYGITSGSYQADFLELTDNGKLATADEAVGRARLAARMQLGIADVIPFNSLYEQFKNNRLPAASVLVDYVVEHDLAHKDNAQECVETFLANARDLGVLANYAGAERLLTFETVLEALADGGEVDDAVTYAIRETRVTDHSRRWVEQQSPAQILADSSDLSDACFFVTPIGSDDSPQRQHADLVLGSLIEPAMHSLGLRVVRADQISKPGMITGQIIEHLVRAPLVIADLSFGNPNVFYELALRHASRKPALQIIRAGDHLPFDVGQFRTVSIDMTSIYTLVPQLDTYRAEIARQSRAALDAEGDSESPLSLFFPRFWDQFGD